MIIVVWLCCLSRSCLCVGTGGGGVMACVCVCVWAQVPKCTLVVMVDLEGEQQQERHHQTEQTHGLGQGEAQDGVREELLLQGGVAGVADDQGAENRSNTGTRSSNTDSGSSGTDEFGRRVNVTAHSGRLEAPDGGQQTHRCHLVL